jgi:Ras-related protein Rab-1A
LVFDTTDESSFSSVRNWLDDVRAYAHENVDVMLVGNKVDLEDKRQVDYNTAKNFANEHLIPYMETSAKNGLNVENVFTTISLTALTHK